MSRLLRILALCALIIANLGPPTAIRAQSGTAHLTCRITPSPLALNGEAALILEIADIQNLYGYELVMTYDAIRVQYQDADAAKEGVNLQVVNTFISPDFVVLNKAENGKIDLALTQLAPNIPRSGGGELARATIVGTGAGFANFTFGEFVFSDNNGNAIPVTKQDCLVEIGEAGEPTPTFTATTAPTTTPVNTNLPTQTPVPVPQQPQAPTATPQPATATPIPTQPQVTPEVTTATPAPTETPTEIPTATEVVVAFSTPTLSAQEAGAPTTASTDGAAILSTPALPTPAALDAPAADLAPNPVPASNEIAAAGETQEAGVSAKVSNPGVVAEAEKSATPTLTPTPRVIARVDRVAPLAVESVPQPPAPTSASIGSFLQKWGWLVLLSAVALAATVFRLSRA